MHSFHGKTCTIHFDADMSGEVHIIDQNNNEAKVSGNDILDFVAEYIRREKISNIERMSTKEILNIYK